MDIFVSFAVLIIITAQQIIPTECLKTIIKFYITSHGFCGSAIWKGCNRNGFSSLHHVRGFSWKDLMVGVTQQLEAGSSRGIFTGIFDSWCWESWPGLSVGIFIHGLFLWALSQHGSKILEANVPRKPVEVSVSLLPSLRTHIMSFLPFLQVLPISRNGRSHHWHYLSIVGVSKSHCQKSMGDIKCFYSHHWKIQSSVLIEKSKAHNQP